MSQVYKFKCPDCGHTESLVSSEHPSQVEHPCPRCRSEMKLRS